MPLDPITIIALITLIERLLELTINQGLASPSERTQLENMRKEAKRIHDSIQETQYDVD